MTFQAMLDCVRELIGISARLFLDSGVAAV
jgi:hypothetical protein